MELWCTSCDEVPTMHVYIGQFPFHFYPDVICYCRSVCCLSSVCNVHAPYSVGWDFRQCFYAILYLSDLLTCIQNFTEIVPGDPLHRRSNARGIAEYSDIGHVEGYISEMVQDTASGTVTDLIGNHNHRSQWYHCGPSRMTPDKSSGPNLRKPFLSLKLMKLGRSNLMLR